MKVAIGASSKATRVLAKLNLPNNIKSFEGIINLKIAKYYDDMQFDRWKKNFSAIRDHFKEEKNGKHAKNKSSDSDQDDHEKDKEKEKIVLFFW